MNKELEAQVKAINQAIIAGHYRLIPVSGKQIKFLNALINGGLKNTRHRIPVIRMLVGDAIKKITGEEFASTKQLTLPVASFLLNQIVDPWTHSLSSHGQWLLEQAEAEWTTIENA